MSIEAMKQALEFLENGNFVYPTNLADALRQAIEQAEQAQPVAYSYTSRITGAHGFSHHPMPRFIDADSWDIKPLYTAPPPRQPLTDERLELIGHADLTINNIYVFSGYGEEVPEGRTPIYAGYKTAHGIKGEA